MLRQESDADLALVGRRGLNLEHQHERFAVCREAPRCGQSCRHRSGQFCLGRDLLHPLRADSAVGKLNQLADQQIAAPAANGDPRGHQETAVRDLRDRGNVRAVIEIESFADAILVGGVRRIGRLRPKPRETANDVIKPAPVEEKRAVASRREGRTDTAPTAVHRFRFPNALGTRVRHHSQSGRWGLYIRWGSRRDGT